MEAPSYFTDFMRNIRLTDNQRTDAITGHSTLRKRLHSDDDLSSIIVATFLQGSYCRHTAVRPKGEERADVDVVVVTNIDADHSTPEEAIGVFVPFVKKHYSGKYRRAARSIQIELSYVDLDLVITAAPSEIDKEFYRSLDAATHGSDEETLMLEAAREQLQEFSTKKPQWQLEPLLIPDRDAGDWEPTHPLSQIAWTVNKNKQCNRHYVNVVKAIKWWRLVSDSTPKYPKGYPLEHIVGDCCPDAIGSIAEGFTLTLAAISSRYAPYVEAEKVPALPDRGVPEHNVLARITPEEFAAFHQQASGAAEAAREALDEEDLNTSVQLWRALFGEKFPAPPREGEGAASKGVAGAYTSRSQSSDPQGGRFA